jgi:hypothetical protein
LFNLAIEVVFADSRSRVFAFSQDCWAIIRPLNEAKLLLVGQGSFIIRDVFSKIHNSFSNLEVSEWVPVPGYPDHPPLDYQELLGLEAIWRGFRRGLGRRSRSPMGIWGEPQGLLPAIQ